MPQQQNPSDFHIYKKAAIDALTQFISKYEPAETRNEAQEFYTTQEITEAIADHTGIRLDSAEIFELMSSMGYRFDSFQGLGFNWLLKKGE